MSFCRIRIIIFVENFNLFFRQDLSRWCGAATSWYGGLFYQISNIQIPVKKKGGNGIGNPVIHYNSIFILSFCAELSGLPYVLPSDLLQCEVTLVGTDYKKIIYQKLDIYNPGKKRHQTFN